MLWIKSLHIIFVVSWFAGLFYLPRIFVNLAMVPNESYAENQRLMLMANKLFRFTTILMIPALGFGIWLAFEEGLFEHLNSSGNMGWFNAKLGVVACTIIYHYMCFKHLKQFQLKNDTHTHIWYRWFNEIPVLFMTLAVILVVVKPF